MTIAIPVARQKLIERIATSSRRLRKRADPLPADELVALLRQDRRLPA